MSKIDRQSLIRRHDIVITQPDRYSPLTVGNGKFAFTADITGLQTFDTYYRKDGQPLCTLAEWGWHTSPIPKWMKNCEYKYKMYKTGDREVPYPTGQDGQWGSYGYLRENPHRCNLAKVGFKFDKETAIDDLEDICQVLNMYTGVLSSKFRVHHENVEVETCAMYESDVIGVKVKSELLQNGRVSVGIDFPFASSSTEADIGTSAHTANHTEIIAEARNFLKLKRMMDDDVYYVAIGYTNASVTVYENSMELFAHENEITFVIWFSKYDDMTQELTFGDVAASSKNALEHYWEQGGIIDFSDVEDERAKILEDRMIKSMYITRINNCGSMPPAETGVTCNSWFGKMHTEMHFWHAAHFAQFGRPELLDRSLNSYIVYMEKLKAIARRQGYQGLRLPKMIDGEMNESPSYIAPLLLWEQPHPLMLAELMYRVNNDKKILEKYFELIEGTVAFMLDFLMYDEEEGRYVLDAPYIPAQEYHAPEDTKNAVYELEYWHFSFVLYKEWCERLGRTPLPELEKKLENLSLPPVIDGLYPAHENCSDTFECFNIDHPSFLCAYGVLPGWRMDRETVGRTLDKVLEVWEWDTTWAWDYAYLSMCAAKLDRCEQAVDILLMDTVKNRYSLNGHVFQYPGLPCYIPANGSFLTALGFLAAGCDENPGSKFPKDWNVKVEGITRYI